MPSIRHVTNDQADLLDRMVAKIEEHQKAMQEGDTTSSYILDGLSDDVLMLVKLFINSFGQARVFLPEDEDEDDG